jgi:hypothetical protein
MESVAQWISELHSYWNQEIPMRIHSSETADDGSPQWHRDFWTWIQASEMTGDRRWKENPEPRVRTTRAFRKLRERHPREYEVLYRTAILQIPLASTADWLNERAKRNQKPERYSVIDTMLILYVGADKVRSWW